MKKRWWVFVAASAAFILAYALVQWRGEDDAHWHPWDTPGAVRDLDAIAADTFRVIVLRDPLVWEPGPSGDMGLAFDWLKRFAKEQGLRMAPVVVPHPDSMLLALWQGRGDAIAAPLHLDRAERQHFRLLEPFAEWEPMLAKLRPEAETEKSDALAPLMDSVQVAAASPFAHHQYRRWKDDRVRSAIARSAAAGEDELLQRVLIGDALSAVVSGLRARLEAERFPVLQFEGPVGEAVPWGFTIRRDAPRLREALEGWMAEPREQEALQQFLKASSGAIAPPGPLRARRMKGIDPDSISPFDHYFRAHAQGLALDWQLLAAMAWKESRFDSTVTSRKGAMGIMQIMPRTAARYGLDTASAMEDHIAAAARYLAKLDTIWLRAVPDRHQRLRFVLASYNAGPGHIIDAARLAQLLGLQPDRWEGHVERAVLLLAKPEHFMRPEMRNGYCKGSQVFRYVRGVLAVHEQLRGRPSAPRAKR